MRKRALRNVTRQLRPSLTSFFQDMSVSTSFVTTLPRTERLKF
ncbi:hypothetical protein AZA_87611 [Nitrospirillum viridazoti Y2]|nr:hypothetical protein AZA_87611 [Nitrospirillum amazonense Y2]